MRKIVLCMHVTLDGFVGGLGGEMDCFHVDEEIFKIAGELTDEADTALYGRVTYDLMDNYWPDAGSKPGASSHDIQHSEWYNRVQKVVVSRSLKGENIVRTEIVSENITGRIEELKKENGKNILIFGSPSVCHILMEHELIDEYWLFVNPVLLGKGIPLFKNIEKRTRLKYLNSITYSSGVVCLQYGIQTK
ncbi:dihydrofolate reductase family protein [soil metagenome]